MTKKETAKILGVIAETYPNFTVTELKVEIWQSMFEDATYQTVVLALKKHMIESKFAPAIAEIRAQISEITAPPIPDAAEAWSSVVRLMGKYGYYRAAEAAKEMDELTKKVVDSLGGFRQLCCSEDDTVDRAHFLKMYGTMAERRRQDALIPAAMREAIGQVRVKMLEGGEGE